MIQLGTVDSLFKYLNPTNGERSIQDEMTAEVYPNPVNQELKVNLSGFKSQKVKYKLYQIDGRMVEEGYWNSVSDGFRIINVSKLNEGQYLLRLSTNGYASSHKFLKTNN